LRLNNGRKGKWIHLCEFRGQWEAVFNHDNEHADPIKDYEFLDFVLTFRGVLWSVEIVIVIIEALCYKLEGRWIESQ
jgi:hypothetical protein